MKTMTGLNYSDVYLIPKYSELHSRTEADISVEFLGRRFKAPWIPANMSSVINIDNAKWLSENGYFYIMHRFGDNYSFIKNASKDNWKLISVSVGVKQQDKDLLIKCLEDERRIDFITIDVAHGDSILVKEMIEFIRNSYQKYTFTCPKIIAGNVCTSDGVRHLEKWGADAAKVGVAGGGSCSTKNMTGFHIPMFSCIEECYKNGGKIINYSFPDPYIPSSDVISPASIPIIADGGIRENGDIAKALVAGGTMVMAGSIFAACIDAPGENIYCMDSSKEPGIRGQIIKKRYYGSASAKQKGEAKNVEGFEVELPCNGLTYKQKYQQLTESISSAISYAGGKDLSAFNTVNYISLK